MNNLKLSSIPFHSLAGTKVWKCKVFILLQTLPIWVKEDEKLLISGFTSNPLILQMSAFGEGLVIS